MCDIKFLYFHIERRHKDKRQLGQFFQKYRQRKQDFHLPRQNIPFFQTAYHTLAEFILNRFALFDTARRLVKIDADIFSLKIVKKRADIFCKIADITFQINKSVIDFVCLSEICHALAEPRRFFLLSLFFKLTHAGLHFLVHAVHPL